MKTAVSDAAGSGRQRPRTTYAAAIKQTVKAGFNIVGVDFKFDGSFSLHFGNPDSSKENSTTSGETPEDLRRLV